MTHTKTDWRQRLLKARQALGPAVRAMHSQAIATRLASLPEFAAGATVLAYVPIGAEVDLTPLLHAAVAAGKLVYAPVENAEGPRWQLWQGVDAAGGPMGAPAMSVPVPALSPIMVIVPGVGFDLEGVRLGRGRGFYDRALADLRSKSPLVAVGVAFEAQVVRRLPYDSWDQPLDLVVTERRCIAPGSFRDPCHARPATEEVHEP
jgi:5-formyltetrahydrofolate cyclo-ligase